MELSELELNRQLYRTQPQTVETLDADEVASNLTPPPSTAIASGNSVYDVNTNGETINGDVITPGTLPPAVLDIANWGWTQTCVFTVTDADTVSWTSGTFTSANGDTYAISAGNTGNMSAQNYIYLDILSSITVYNITTNVNTPVGVGKVLIAVAQNGSLVATYNLVQAHQIVGDNIIANTINATKITAGSITATQLSTTILYAGSITIDTNGNIKGGMTQYNLGNGFFLGYSGGQYKFSVGDSSGAKMLWDGSSLTIIGSLTSSVGNQRVVISGTSAGYYNASGTLIAHTIASSNSFLIAGDQSNSNIIFDAGTSGVVAFSHNGTLTILSTTATFSPFADVTMDLGAAAFNWKDFYLGGQFIYQGTVQGVSYFGEMEFVSETVVKTNTSGWGVTKVATGRYQITHGLGTTNYSVVLTPFASLVKWITVEALASNSFTARIANSSATLEDNSFFFSLFQNV